MFKNPRDRHSSEAENRLDWWLREYGRCPSRVQLLRIRAYKREQRLAERRAA